MTDTDTEIIAELRRENAELRKRVEELRKEIEEWRRGHRERSKRRSSRAEGTKRGGTGRGPGRPAGAKGSNRAVPTEIQREQEHPLPAECPACGGAVVQTGTQSTVVQDLPQLKVENVRHIGGIGHCESCKARVTANLSGASNVGDAATQVQLGPGLVALALSLRFDEHVSLYGISRLFDRWFGVHVTPSGLSQLFERQQARTAPVMTEIKAKLRQSSVVGIDETGLRQNGVAAWVWLLRNQYASLFRVELSRGAWVADQLLGEDFSGTVCSDFYGVYTRRDDWIHAYCNAHTIREAKKIAEVSADPLAARFSSRLRDILHEGQLAQRSGDPLQQDKVKRRMRYLIGCNAFSHLHDIVRLQNRIDEHFDGVLLFVDHPDVPMTNNATERDIRPLALHRKVTGGTRSPAGSLSLAHWMSVTQTLRKNDLHLRDWITGAFDAHLHHRPPPSVFAQPN